MLLQVFCALALTYGLARGQNELCSTLPDNTRFSTDYAMAIRDATSSDTSVPFMFHTVYYNCIAYGGTDGNSYRQITVTATYTFIDSLFGQATYTCQADGSWMLTGQVQPINTGQEQNNTAMGCLDCTNSAVDSTCTACTDCTGLDRCDQNGVCCSYRNGGSCVAMCPVGHFSSDAFDCISLCDNNPCQNGGTCTPLTPMTYSCDCDSGFCGTDCQDQRLGCCTDPCQNGGTCTSNDADTFNCSCAQFYAGDTCIDDLCVTNPCQNGGTCRANLGQDYTCTCPFGLTGKNCEQEVDFCDPSPCLNGGYCISQPRIGPMCDCLQGFGGGTCHLALTTCQSDAVCENNGECRSRTVGSLTGSYCSCMPGFAGMTCADTINSCGSSNPCFYNSTCLASPGSTPAFRCQCDNEWTGFYCDSCSLTSSDCGNGVVDPQCKCICDTLWTGSRCDTCNNLIEQGNCVVECTQHNHEVYEQTHCFACGIENCLSCGLDRRCVSCITNYNWSTCDNQCVLHTEFRGCTEDDNEAERIGIIVGSIVGALIISCVAIALLIVAFCYIRKTNRDMTDHAADKRTTKIDREKKVELQGVFYNRNSAGLFTLSSGGRMGGLGTLTQSAFSTGYAEMKNETIEDDDDGDDDEVAGNTNKAAFENKAVDADDNEDEWLPPPDD